MIKTCEYCNVDFGKPPKRAVRQFEQQGSSDGIVLLCQRCGRPFQTDTIRALCGACQRAQEVAG